MTGKEIKELRKELKMTQQELADALGVSRVSVNNWETETKHPSRLANRELARLRNKRNNAVKRYEVQNKAKKQVGLMYAHNAQEACEKLGWILGDCFVKELRL